MFTLEKQHKSFPSCSVLCKILHINYRNICGVDCGRALHIHAHKLVNCSWPNTHDAVKYRSCRTRSALTGTAYVSMAAFRSLRHQPHTSYRGLAQLSLPHQHEGKLRIVGDQHLSAVFRCHSSLRLPPSM